MPVTYCNPVDSSGFLEHTYIPNKKFFKCPGSDPDHKRCAPFVCQDVPFDNIDWEYQTENLSNTPITVPNSNIAYPDQTRITLNLLENTL